MAFVFECEVKSSDHASETLHCLSDFVGFCSRELSERHGGDSVFDVDADGDSEFHLGDVPQRGDEIEEDSSSSDADVLCVEVAFCASVVIASDAFLQSFLHFQSAVHNERSAGLNEGGVVCEAFEIGFLRAVDVEVVGVRGGDDGGKGSEMMEGAVKLISFYHNEGTFFGKEIVRSVVLYNASEEGVAAHVAFVQEVGGH